MRLSRLALALTAPSLLAVLIALSGVFFPTTGADAQGNERRSSSSQRVPHFQWNLDPSPNVGTGTNILVGVTAGFPYDVWAVGSSNTTDRGGDTLTQHWNGTNWHVVPSPDQGLDYNILLAVDSYSSRDVWAVGAYYSGESQYTLIEHWNGTAWSIVPSPNPGFGGNALSGVSVLGRNNVWAVGSYNHGPGDLFNKTLIMRWNGSSWQTVSSPNPPGFNALGKVVAISSTDAWAVGITASNNSLTNMRPLVMRWNGTAWNTVAVPMPAGATEAGMSSVAAQGPNNVWAVGAYKGQDGLYHSLAMRWDGQQWTLLPTYNAPGTAYNTLSSVAVTWYGEVWAVGWSAVTTPPNVFAPPLAYPGVTTTILRWNGTGWDRAISPTPGTGSQLLSIAVLGDRAWAVGNYSDVSGPNKTLIESYIPANTLNAPTNRLSAFNK